MCTFVFLSALREGRKSDAAIPFIKKFYFVISIISLATASNSLLERDDGR